MKVLTLFISAIEHFRCHTPLSLVHVQTHSCVKNHVSRSSSLPSRLDMLAELSRRWFFMQKIQLWCVIYAFGQQLQRPFAGSLVTHSSQLVNQLKIHFAQCKFVVKCYLHSHRTLSSLCCLHRRGFHMTLMWGSCFTDQMEEAPH